MGRNCGSVANARYTVHLQTILNYKLIDEKFCSYSCIAIKYPELAWLNKSMCSRITQGKLGPVAIEKYKNVLVLRVIDEPNPNFGDTIRLQQQIDSLNSRLANLK